ncbi:MAG: MFS transporter [Alphaproteobacteria bacterium]|nr:MFS transporter [Alphaproteobacteria bacterium]MCW5739958.1 MFS transporter [Alphaproteobacteria bacterium]
MNSPPRLSTDWKLATLLMIAGIAAATQIGKVPPALPAIRAELGIDLRAAGWFVSLVNLTTALIGILMALAADRIGHRRLVIFGLLLGSAASAAGAVTHSAAALFALRILEGLGFLSVAVPVPALILRITAPADTRRMMGYWGAYLPAGAGAMAFASAGLLPWMGWHGVWWASALLLLVVALAVLASKAGLGDNAIPLARGRSLWRDVAATAGSAGPLAIGICFGLYSGAWFALIGFLPTLQVERLGFSIPLAAAIGAGVIAVNVCGSLVAGQLLHRGVPRLAVLSGTALIMAATAVLVFFDWLPPLVRLVMAFAFSASASAIPGALFGAIPVHAPRPDLIGATNGVLMQCSNIGALIGPPVVAALVTAGGWSWAALYTTPALLASIAAAWVLHRREAVTARP